jgi:hypothetical protein
MYSIDLKTKQVKLMEAEKVQEDSSQLKEPYEPQEYNASPKLASKKFSNAIT